MTDLTCKSCGFAGPHETELQTNGVHYAKEICGKCRRWIRWIPKPDTDASKYKRPQEHRDLVEEYGRGFCEMCLRRKDELPKGQTLEGQHVIEYTNGGKRERSNIWIVCTACHRLIHWVRTYRSKSDNDLLLDGSAINTSVRDIVSRLENHDGDHHEELPDIPF